MKIYPNGLPATLYRDGRPWATARSLMDPTILMLCYVGAMVAVDTFMQVDLIGLIVIAVVSYPGRLPFHRMSRDMVPPLLMSWLVPALMLLLLTALLHLAFPREPLLVDPRVGMVWSMLSVLSLLVVHTLTPCIAPKLWGLYKQSNVLIVGVNAMALRLARHIASGEAEGQKIVGYVEDRSADRIGMPHEVKVVGTFSQIEELIATNNVSVIYLSMPMHSGSRVLQLLERLRDTTASIYFIPDVSISEMIQGHVVSVGGLPMLSVCESPFHSSGGATKRALDLLLCLALIPVALPLLAAIALLIKLTCGGPVLFRQRRFGLDGCEIEVLKFRTMKVAEDGSTTYRQVTPQDERVTPLGRFLRKTSLDELPQLLNVLAGSMSLVGPRPHALAVNRQFRKLIPGYMVRHKVKPGITGWAQVHGCRGGDDLPSMRLRTEYDLQYLRNWSVAMDLVILWKTALMLVRGDDKAY